MVDATPFGRCLTPAGSMCPPARERQSRQNVRSSRAKTHNVGKANVHVSLCMSTSVCVHVYMCICDRVCMCITHNRVHLANLCCTSSRLRSSDSKLCFRARAQNLRQVESESTYCAVQILQNVLRGFYCQKYALPHKNMRYCISCSINFAISC